MNEPGSRSKFAEAARAVARGDAPLLDGVRALLGLGSSLGLYDNRDPDFDMLIGFDSETDCLPSGDERANWESNALAGEDVKIAAAEFAWAARVRDACSRLARRFDDADA